MPVASPPRAILNSIEPEGTVGDSLFSPAVQSIFSRLRDTGGTPKAFPSPLDWRDPWIYFIMVDRFNNSAAPPRHQPFDDPNFFGFQGGNFAGIKDQLPYIQGLGAGAIWLSPVLKNVPFEEGTYHGYGIHDFLRADPRFATDPQHADDELRSLVDAAHNLGMYVILDIVLNHTGNVFAYDGAAKRTSRRRRATSSGATKTATRIRSGRTSRPSPIPPPTRWCGPASCTTIPFSAARVCRAPATIRPAISPRSSSSARTRSSSSSS